MIPIHPTRRSSPLRDWLDVPKDPYKPHQHRTLKKKTPFTDPLRDTDYSQWSSRRNAASLGRAAGILPGCHEIGDKDEDRAEEGRHRDFLLGNTNVQHGNLYDSAISQHVSFPCFVLCTFPVSISCPTVVARAAAAVLRSRWTCTLAISGKSLSRNKKGSGTETEDRQDFNSTST